MTRGGHLRVGLAAAAALLIGAILGVAAGRDRWRQAPSAGFAQAQYLILTRAADMPAGGVAVFGDSIVEPQRLETLCGLPAFNAGIGGARLADMAPLVPRIVAAIRPARSVVALGTNDLRGRRRTPVAAFTRQLDGVLATVGPRPIVVGITASAADPPGVAELNGVLRAAAQRHGGVFVEPPPPAMTVDGVHLSPAGMQDWRRRVDAACAPSQP